LNYLAFQSFAKELTWWRLFRKRVVIDTYLRFFKCYNANFSLLSLFVFLIFIRGYRFCLYSNGFWNSSDCVVFFILLLLFSCKYIMIADISVTTLFWRYTCNSIMFNKALLILLAIYICCKIYFTTFLVYYFIISNVRNNNLYTYCPSDES
jgi:hypothetical protein